MNILKSIFKSASKDAFKRLDEGKTISFAPKSDRYTYIEPEDMQYDKNWVPSTAEERRTLSPEGYYRVGDRSAVKQELKDGIYGAALINAKANGAANPEAAARDAADEIFDKEYKEKQISVDSTALQNVEYNPKTEGLYVTFQGSNKKYFYPAVPIELVQALMKAPSKGEFFMSKIHDQYSMNPSHLPVGRSPSYGKMDKKRVDRFYKKYTKNYEKKNKNKWKK